MEHRQKLEPTRARHRIRIFRPQEGMVICACDWHRKDQKGLVFEKCKDWLLDEYNQHLTEKRAERKVELEALRAARKQGAA